MLHNERICHLYIHTAQDALEHKQKMEAENKALKEKLDREAGELKKKMADADDEKAEEMKILQNRLDSERRLLNEKMEREKVNFSWFMLSENSYQNINIITYGL